MKSEIDDCPLCGRSTLHEHIISNALEPGAHSTYEELLAEVEDKRVALEGLTGAAIEVLESLKKAEEWNNGSSKFMATVLKTEIDRLNKGLSNEDVE